VSSGPGPITPDGCAVEVYARMPTLGEPEIVHGAVRAGATVLDLGCGSGRVAHGLIELGHPVVGVDQSTEMLAHVRGAETVHAQIAGLRLDRCFDAVLLASHLVNTPDSGERRALWAAAARHLAPGGRVIVEWHPPSWFDTVPTGVGAVGDLLVELTGVVRDGDLLSATVRYWSDSELWTQAFTARRLTDRDVERELAETGLRFDGWLTDDHAWFAAAAPV
jgi:SAM-dependent methyltransferase